MSFSDSFFAAKFGLTRRDLENYLSEALSRGGDYADLYFEYLATSSISIDESIVKSATQGVSLGVGVRVIAGERTGYAYSGRSESGKDPQCRASCGDDRGRSIEGRKTPLDEGAKRNLYPVLTAPGETAFRERVDSLARRRRRAGLRSSSLPGTGDLRGQLAPGAGRNQRWNSQFRSATPGAHECFRAGQRE